MNKFIKHYVSEMDDTFIQRCIICGAIISDYSHAAWPADQPPPKGFESRYIYVRAGNPKYFTIDLPPDAEYETCT